MLTKLSLYACRNLNPNLKQNKCIIPLEFADNSSYVIQDLVQGFHWTNSPATLNSFAMYFKDDQEMHQNLCYYTLPDCLNHDASIAFMLLFTKCYGAQKYCCLILNFVITTVMVLHHNTKLTRTFRKVYHEKNHGIPTEWHFFNISSHFFNITMWWYYRNHKVLQVCKQIKS